jgi:hypothetical protein
MFLQKPGPAGKSALIICENQVSAYLTFVPIGLDRLSIAFGGGRIARSGGVE